jgi:hypothetical protein
MMSCQLHQTNSRVVSTKQMKEKIEKYGALRNMARASYFMY